ncbi:MAG: helix-turn-helix transcriptional regulator [Coriobacteriia bacterium]|nr:helix-turn-helix transcriptional regulator [Coriobacteriia bacterium]
MNTKNVLDILLSQEQATRYRLAKKLGIHESQLSRAYNGKSDPGFNEVAQWLDAFGLSLAIVPNANNPIDDPSAYDISFFGRELHDIGSSEYDYFKVHRMLKQILQNHSSSAVPPLVIFYPESIQNNEWRAFYAATIAYLFKKAGKRVPRFAGVRANKTTDTWSPIKNLGRSHTEFDETYLQYNVLLPKGELAWI